MEIYYKNNYGDIINFMGPEIRLIINNSLASYAWGYESADTIRGYGGKISAFTRDITEKPLEVGISAADMQKTLNTMLKTFEKDVLSCTPGKLYINNTYIKCYIISGTIQTDWTPGVTYLRKKINIAAERTFWISEKIFEFAKPMSNLGKKYPHGYNYRYSTGSNTSFTNEHFVDSDFILTIHGPCTDPEIRISDHIYALRIALSAGETVAVDSIAGTIVKTDKYGNKTSAFHTRNMKYSVFRKIPSGFNTVEWQGEFDFTVTLLMERSEPLWT